MTIQEIKEWRETTEPRKDPSVDLIVCATGCKTDDGLMIFSNSVGYVSYPRRWQVDYLKLLEYSYLIKKETGECPPDTRAEFLAESIFDFTTYDSEMSDLFGRKAVEVCTAINDRKTFDYQKEGGGYQWYLIMCNMPFFAGKLEWGTSIRGAWWNLHGSKTFEISSCELWENGAQILTPLQFNVEQWKSFIAAMAIFAAVVDET